MALIPWWIRYPNVNDEIMNLDWLLRVSNENTDKISNFINLNTIKYADPILWNITSQYEANTIVVDGQTGNAYISTKAVPSGVHLNRDEYWTQIYNYSNELETLRLQISFSEGNTTTATRAYAVDTLVFVNDKLYRVIAPMIAGDSFVVDSNIVKTTIEAELIRIKTHIDSVAGDLSRLQIPASNLVAAINAVVDALTDQVGDLSSLQIPATNLVAAINAVVDSLTAQVGDLSSLQIPANNLVVAINAVVDSLTAQIGDLSSLQIPANNLVAAINAVVDSLTAQIGDLSDLTYPASSIVDAINKKGLERFTNKKILIIGDSNSNEIEGVINWVKVLRTTLPNTVIDNVSYNGALFMGAGGQAKNYFDNISAHYDFIIVVCGTNDCYHQAGIGTLDLGTTNSWNDFGAALSSFYNAVNNKDVTAQVCFVSPIKNSGMSSDGISRVTPLEVYRMMINRACALFGWTLIDAGHNAPYLEPYNTANAAKWLTDGTHMSEDYAPIFCNYILDKILSGGDTPCGKGIQSTIVLNSLFNTGFTGDCICEFNSDGSATITLNVGSTSLGAGVAIIPVSGLPTYLRHKYLNYFFCTDNFKVVGIGRVMANGDIQIFPVVTETTGFSATIHIPATTSCETSYQTII